MIGTKDYVLVLDGFADWEPALRARLERAVSEGELPVACQAMTTFYATVQQGMSIPGE
jgi:hypothetical protein